MIKNNLPFSLIEDEYAKNSKTIKKGTRRSQMKWHFPSSSMDIGITTIQFWLTWEICSYLIDLLLS